MRKLWRRCPPRTLIFPGHEYTVEILRDSLADGSGGGDSGGGHGGFERRMAMLEEVSDAECADLLGGSTEELHGAMQWALREAPAGGCQRRRWLAERGRLWRHCVALHRAQALRAMGLPTVPTTLAAEYGYNGSFDELHSAASAIQFGWRHYLAVDEALEAATDAPRPPEPGGIAASNGAPSDTGVVRVHDLRATAVAAGSYSELVKRPAPTCWSAARTMTARSQQQPVMRWAPPPLAVVPTELEYAAAVDELQLAAQAGGDMAEVVGGWLGQLAVAGAAHCPAPPDVRIDYLSGGLAAHTAAVSRGAVHAGAMHAPDAESTTNVELGTTGNGVEGVDGDRLPQTPPEVLAEAALAATVTDQLHELLLAFATLGGSPGGRIDPVLLRRGLVLLGDAPLAEAEMADFIAEAKEATAPGAAGSTADAYGVAESVQVVAFVVGSSWYK